ncbi:type 1 glutamine amidotransferase [Jeotgalibacillus marinus]|uniref:Lipid II isoglutaminyl synthase (glutamine-hydrolyzing) subunit GatD n=1 Tax=Jeotgalibacillus marinus TaxID=86667 RepID=A0ABV3Q5Y6_9BACL
MNLTLFHFYSDQLNLYGDRGNVIALKKRAEWRGITLDVVDVKAASAVDLTKADVLLIGGGPDRLQALCTDDLRGIKGEFKQAIDDGVSALTIGGGYQLLGEYYELPDGKKLQGLGVLDFYTHSPSSGPRERLIGNILLESPRFGRIAGFENHGGRTYHDYETLGDVVAGHGNNGKDKKEGLLYNNLIGTYLHGPVLPKNPALTDFLLEAAWKRKTGNPLPPYEQNELENAANRHLWDVHEKKV